MAGYLEGDSERPKADEEEEVEEEEEETERAEFMGLEGE